MLIKCKECNLQISDKAIACPHCGFPLKSILENPTRGKRKKKRLPNGFGQITKIQGNLRNPYRAMVTVGKTEEGKPICRLLKPKAYFETYNDAYKALVDYNLGPYEFMNTISCKDLYEKWIKEYEEKVSKSSLKSTKAIWNYCEPVYDMPVNLIRIRHIKGLMQGRNTNTKKRLKSLWNLLLDYAVEYEVTDKNYARMFNINEKTIVGNAHITFTDEEMEVLWQNKNDRIVSIILIQCYMGWRPQELCEIKLVDVDLKNHFIIGGLKTEAGKKRIVYVLPAIQDLVQKWYDSSMDCNSEWLFAFTHRKKKNMSYDMYKNSFDATIEKLKLNPAHRPHDCRKQFVTMAKRANVDEYAIKKLVGHAISDITEKIYTNRDPEWLKNEIIKITV